MPRRAFLRAVASMLLIALLALPGSSSATYRGKSGTVAWELYSVDSSGVPSDRIQTLSGTIVACGPQSSMPMCAFGRLSYSPDGSELVVSKQVPSSGSFGTREQGSLMLVGANGSGVRDVPRQTADDEQPAFLPSGRIVFAGRATNNRAQNLYSVGADGTGLIPLTSTGGAWPAPCGNGTIAFMRHGSIYLLGKNGRSQRRLTSRGAEQPDCSPDSRRVAFVRHDALYTIGANGKRLRRIRTPHPVSFPSYSPLGHAIAYDAHFNASDGSQSELDVVNPHGHLAERYVLGALSSRTMGEGTTQSEAGAIAWQPEPARP